MKHKKCELIIECAEILSDFFPSGPSEESRAGKVKEPALFANPSRADVRWY